MLHINDLGPSSSSISEISSNSPLPPPSTSTTSTLDQYNYNYADGTQHRQLHRIWETTPDGELLINRNTAHGEGEPKPTSSSESSIRPVFLDIYLPNGVLLPIQCPAQRTLALLKQDVFIQARKYPLASRLNDISNYVFSTIGLDGAHVELYDEQKPIASLQFLFLPLLILLEPDGNKTEKELNQSIGLVMGIPLNELERSMSEELHQYRLRLFETCREAEKKRGTCSFGHYAFPEDPLLVVHPGSIQFGLVEVNQTGLDYAQFPEQPTEVEQRAMEKLRRKVQFSDAYVEVWYGTSFPATAKTGVDEPTAITDAAELAEQFKHCVHIRNALEMTSEDVVHIALREFRAQHGLNITEQPSDFILQIAGRRVFITRRDVFLPQFEYVRSCFENYRIPRFILRLKKRIFRDYPPPPESFEPAYVRRERHNSYLKKEAVKSGEGSPFPAGHHSSQQSQQQQTRLFWDLDDNLRLRIHSASHITVQDGVDRLFIRVAVAVGRHILDVRDSATVAPSNPRWQESNIEFDVYLKDLPESAQLCFSLISVHCSASSSNANASHNSKRKNGKNSKGHPISSASDHLLPIGWANLRLFDWRNHFQQSKRTLYLRPFGKLSVDPSLQFLNFDYCYGHGDSFAVSSRTSRLEIELFEYFDHPVVIVYPPESVVQRYIAWIRQQRKQSKECDGEEEEETEEYGGTSAEGKRRQRLFKAGDPNLDRLHRLRRCLDSAHLSEDDQRFLWRFRYKIRRLFPQMLPVLADCALLWRDRESSSEFYALLAEWPPLQVDTACELLDGRYVDAKLRAMAVHHLDNALNDDQLQLYLLILVQAIRYEPHAFSPLVRMLLVRALMDYRVGHTLFWLLRAELAHLLAIDQSRTATTGLYGSSEKSLSSLFSRYALLLEAYCRGNSVHLQSMIKQVEMISTLTALSSTIRACGSKEMANKKLQQELFARKETMQHIVSPVNATDHLGELIVEECRVLGSAKQPLFLTWHNPEALAHLTMPNHQLIFKCGDDMRQDMLIYNYYSIFSGLCTVMRIMDAKWKCQLQQDYCMTLYEVLPMGKNIGLIHVVPECQTLFQIQCDTKRKYTGTSLNMEVDLLNKHIYKKCCANDSKKYLECVDRFTFSLAGYCVATYVLGIKDRHQDNIMLARDGRIFHIDFGHFLGHTKRKLGINRERTEFILTDHFLYVISRGKSNFRQTYEYSSFRDECARGFLVLHNQARFFIAIFRMMCCMGLPELNSLEHVDFLRQSLMYDQEERSTARAAFQQIFDDVVKGDWSVQLNWFFHSVRHM
ncbi:hypothetical protein GPALN_005542 [Globodera pallida]|nr:hypothetical protein GPALN_005542 [Globodera pallida]